MKKFLLDVVALFSKIWYTIYCSKEVVFDEFPTFLIAGHK